jgi:hypothetical protein
VTYRRSPDEIRQCIKCGREIGANETICDVCNRAGMATPSASQYHGTVAVAIVAAVAVLAILASLSLRGVGPYVAEVRDIDGDGRGGIAVSYRVTNEGTSAGRAKCQLVALGAASERLRAVNTVTAQIDGGETAEQSVTIPGLAHAPSEVTVDCS